MQGKKNYSGFNLRITVLEANVNLLSRSTFPVLYTPFICEILFGCNKNYYLVCVVNSCEIPCIVSRQVCGFENRKRLMKLLQNGFHCFEILS